MAKDIIFTNKPKKKTPIVEYLALPAPPRRQFNLPQFCFSENQIDLDDYFPLQSYQTLEKDDIYFESGRRMWLTTMLIGDVPKTEIHKYYRKKNRVYSSNYTPYSPFIDKSQYEQLSPNDTIEEGDEFYNGKRWTKSGNVDTKVGELFVYRRFIGKK